MSENILAVRFNVNFKTVLVAVLFLHASLLTIRQLPSFEAPTIAMENNRDDAIKIRSIKITGDRKGRIKTDAFLPNKVAQNLGVKQAAAPKSPVSLKDLSVAKTPEMPKPQMERPGTRPEVKAVNPIHGVTLKDLPTSNTPGATQVQISRAAKSGAKGSEGKEMTSISLKDNEFKDFAKSHPSGGVAISNFAAGSDKISDALVSIEVPEGVEPSELNKYELMFYGFQRRTAMNYAGSIMKNLTKFLRENPNFKLDQNVIMTARMTFDEKGNVKQIKMIRWTNIDKLQSFFEDVTKGIDQLHNPPKALWEKNNEFSMFFTLEINNG